MAFQYYVSVKGTKQGQFKGESKPADGKDKWIPVIGFDMNAEVPTDSTAGAATGKRQHKPIHIIKEAGPADPQIFQTLCNNEVLSEVAIETRQQEQVVSRITLTNAQIAKFETSKQLPFGVQTSGKRFMNLELNCNDISFYPPRPRCCSRVEVAAESLFRP
jgi:type VI secretion system secreted protein Hcp